VFSNRVARWGVLFIFLSVVGGTEGVLDTVSVRFGVVTAFVLITRKSKGCGFQFLFSKLVICAAQIEPDASI
jgi:hypothetical protein